MMASKRTELYGLKPAVGDLVRTGTKQRKTEAEEEPEAVSVLTEADVDKFTIENVVLPLPGKNKLVWRPIQWILRRNSF